MLQPWWACGFLCEQGDQDDLGHMSIGGGGEEAGEPGEAEEGDDAEGEHGWRGAWLARIGRGDC